LGQPKLLALLCQVKPSAALANFDGPLIPHASSDQDWKNERLMELFLLGRALFVAGVRLLIIQACVEISEDEDFTAAIESFVSLFQLQLTQTVLNISDLWSCEGRCWTMIAVPDAWNLALDLRWPCGHPRLVFRDCFAWASSCTSIDEDIFLTDREIEFFATGIQSIMVTNLDMLPELQHWYGNFAEACPCGCRSAALLVAPAEVAGILLLHQIGARRRFLMPKELMTLKGIARTYSGGEDNRLALVGIATARPSFVTSTLLGFLLDVCHLESRELRHGFAKSCGTAALYSILPQVAYRPCSVTINIRDTGSTSILGGPPNMQVRDLLRHKGIANLDDLEVILDGGPISMCTPLVLIQGKTLLLQSKVLDLPFRQVDGVMTQAFRRTIEMATPLSTHSLEILPPWTTRSLLIQVNPSLTVKNLLGAAQAIMSGWEVSAFMDTKPLQLATSLGSLQGKIIIHARGVLGGTRQKRSTSQGSHAPMDTLPD
jgi:hypothetical protein